jgi:hypothetical protein
MAIAITEFTNASISVSPTGVSGGNFGILGFLTNEEGVILPAERARAYTGLASVGEDWAATSEVYKAATAFYSQTPTPKDFTVLMAFETSQSATLVGGGSSTVSEFLPLVGDMEVTVDGTTEEITLGSFSGATTKEGIATILTTALASAVDAGVADATAVWNGIQFVLTSGSTGNPISSINFCKDVVGSDELATAFGFAQHQAKISNGLEPETPVGALAVSLSLGIDFIGLATHKKYRDVLTGATGTTTEEVADWAEAAKKIFCNTSNDLTVLSSVIDTDVFSVLKGKSLRFTLNTFSKNVSQYPSASVFGRAASVNFEGIGSTLTLNLKQMPTISVEDLTPNEFAVLRSKRGSAVVQIGKGVTAYTDSRMAGGSWLDTTHGLLWLENRIETDMFNLLYQSNNKVPFTQAGLNTAQAVLERSLEAAVRNGLAAAGFLPDGTFLPLGWVVEAVTLGNVPSGDKGSRAYRGLSFKMVGAGALHEISVDGQFAE